MNEVFLERVRCKNHPDRIPVAKCYSQGVTTWSGPVRRVIRFFLCEECFEQYKKLPNHVEVIKGRRIRHSKEMTGK